MGKELPRNLSDFLEKFILDENDFWMILAFMLFLLHDIKMQKQWDEFEYELIYDNRFSSNHAIVEEVHRRETEAAIMVPRGRFFTVLEYTIKMPPGNCYCPC